MADGDVIYFDGNLRVWEMLKGATGTSNGVWVDTGPNRRGAVLTVGGISGDTVDLRGASTETIPSNSADGESVLSTAADGTFQVGDLPRWVKIKFTRSAGTVTANLVASRG